LAIFRRKKGNILTEYSVLVFFEYIFVILAKFCNKKKRWFFLEKNEPKVLLLQVEILPEAVVAHV
jgi:hypothetical protein